MDITRKALVATASAEGEGRQVRVVCSTATVDRQGDIVVQAGIDVTRFRELKTVLWNHDQDHPIARAVEVGIVGDHIEALIAFPDPGISKKADEVYGLIKAGIINAVSIGFGVIAAEPIDPKQPKKGVRVTEADLWEVSFVSVPANPQAQIMERSMSAQTKRVLPEKAKGFYEVGQLVAILRDLGWLQDCVEWEAVSEEDDSDIPERLRTEMAALGQILIDMTAEEVGEMIAAHAKPGEKTAATVKRLAVEIKATRQNPAIKAGARLSKATRGAMEEACAAIAGGLDTLKGLMETEGDGTDDADDGAVDKCAGDAFSVAKAALRERLKAVLAP